MTPLTCHSSYSYIRSLRHHETTEEVAEGPGESSEKDVGTNWGSTTVRLGNLGPIFKLQYSSLLSDIPYFIHSIEMMG